MSKSNKIQNQNRQKKVVQPSPKRAQPPQGGMGVQMANSYFQSLVDPFNYEGCRLGWGCMVPTNMTTLYYRGTVGANADGSLAIAAIPNAKGLVAYANGGIAVSFATSAASSDAMDQSAISANFSAGRVISIGVKAIPSIAATSAPGVSYSGAIEGSNTTLFGALTPADLAASTVAIQGIASVGARATGRPQDTNSFIFAPQVTNATGFASTVAYPCSIPFVAFAGMPASCSVAFEVVVNIEVMTVTQHSSAGIGMSKSIGETLASYWPSFENMWSKVQPSLPPPGKPSLEWVSVASSLMSVAGQLGSAYLDSKQKSVGGFAPGLMAYPPKLKQLTF